MARKGENIYKRKDKRWEGRYKKGRKPDGTLAYGFVYGNSYSEVKSKLIEYRYKYMNTSGDFESFRGTVREWSMYYIEDVMKSGIKESTRAHYENIIQNHILPYFGAKKLISITKTNIESFVDCLIQKELSVGSISGIFGILNRMFQKAVIKRVLLANPCVGVVLPRREKNRIEILTINEQRALEQAACQDKYGTAVILALYTGMRIGEISALRWSDIDFESGIIYVQRTVQRISEYNDHKKTTILFDKPKSLQSERLIPMPQKIKELLIKERVQSKSEYVVCCKNSFAEPRVIRYRFSKIIQKAGVRYVSFHTLRHTFASRCMELHMDIVTLSRLLGHSSIKMTLDTYTDSVLEQRIMSMNLLDNLITFSSK